MYDSNLVAKKLWLIFINGPSLKKIIFYDSDLLATKKI